MNLGREFSKEKICIKVGDIEQIERLVKIINEWLFEDVSAVKSKLYHGVYDLWLKKGYKLSVGKINGQVEVLDDSVFKNYRIVGCNEFINNLKEW